MPVNLPRWATGRMQLWAPRGWDAYARWSEFQQNFNVWVFEINGWRVGVTTVAGDLENAMATSCQCQAAGDKLIKQAQDIPR